jgi:transporter family protein
MKVKSSQPLALDVRKSPQFSLTPGSTGAKTTLLAPYARRLRRVHDDDAGSPAMSALLSAWPFWALLSAAFAALTAIFAKVGVENVNSDLATFVRTLVVIAALAVFLTATDRWQTPGSLSRRTYVFLVLSGLATGASWVCYFRALKLGDASQVAPIDKLSVVLVAIFATMFLGERLAPVNWAGVALIGVGAILVAWSP